MLVTFACLFQFQTSDRVTRLPQFLSMALARVFFFLCYLVSAVYFTAIFQVIMNCGLRPGDSLSHDMFMLEKGNFLCFLYTMTRNALALDFTEAVAKYMQAKFRCRVQNSEISVPFPSEWDFMLVQECDHLVNILVEAHKNTCKLSTPSDRPFFKVPVYRCNPVESQGLCGRINSACNRSKFQH